MIGPTQKTPPLRTALEQVNPGDHLCSIYENHEEQLAVAVPFIKIGLDRREKCVYIADDDNVENFQNTLRREGVDVDQALKSKSLTVLRKDQAYMKRGCFDPEWMFDFWSEAARKAVSEGFTGLRASGETEWVARGGRGLERWMEYESTVSHTLADTRCATLCQYNSRIFPAELIRDVIRTHSTAVYGGTVCRNMYFVPPEEFLGSNVAAREVERLLANIREREQVEHELRRTQHILLKDIEQRKRAEAEGRKLSSLVEHSTDFIGIASLDGQAEFVNASGQALLGIDGEDQVRRPILEYVAQEDRDRFQNEALCGVRREGRWEGETLFRHFRTGASIPMWQEIFFITEERTGRRVSLATISRDITERKRASAQAQTAQAQLAHMARVTLMGELAASIAHEVNQPLTAVVTNGNACLRWLDRENVNLEEAREATARIIKEGSRAAEVIHKIRSLLKKSAPQITPVDMNEAIREVVSLIGHEVFRSGVALHTQLSEELPSVNADRVLLQQVILNLVINALEAMRPVAPGQRDLVIASQNDPPKGILVSVADSGIGLTAEMSDQLFRPFFTTKPEGMGMGLAISRSIVETHGGRLWATQNDRSGATFQFSVPVTAAGVHV
ncbi:MAG: Adenylate cyclase [Bryobacterales bacterium]|nr:Adenylate cyclase [Bryobacterales bacterium]